MSAREVFNGAYKTDGRRTWSADPPRLAERGTECDSRYQPAAEMPIVRCWPASTQPTLRPCAAASCRCPRSSARPPCPGEADALVHMLASDVKQLERIRDEPNVDHTRSVIVLSRLIDRPRA